MKSRQLIVTLQMFLSLVALFVMPTERSEAAKRMPPPRRYTFDIAADTPLKDLLPTPPTIAAPLYLTEDLAQVPEVTIGELLRKDTKDTTEKGMAHAVAKINHLNKKDPDGFLKALLANRADLRGLPFLMGKACKTEVKPAQLFANVVEHAQDELFKADILQRISKKDEDTSSQFWEQHSKRMWETNKHTQLGLGLADLNRAQIAALAQMLGPRPSHYRAQLAQHLATIKQAEAARALASLALFAPEESVRAAAIKGLGKHAAKDYQESLLRGFGYPLAVVSQRAADALVKLACKDALADLVNVLEQPDPRAPHTQTVDGKEATVVRELVRVNHHRNCLLCHAPANTEGVPRDISTAPLPLPDMEFPANSGGGYGFGSSPDIFVRVDVTYLRQDFSMMMMVDNAKPWPEMQRFDFFVRTRVLTPAEAKTYAAQVAERGTPASHVAVQRALRELSGLTPGDATPAGWRKALGL